MKTIRSIPLIILFYLLQAVSVFGETDLVLSKSYWVDDSAKAPLAEARWAAFTAFEGSLAEGYSAAALWMKVRIAGRNDGERLAIVVAPAFLQRVELFDPEINGFKADPMVSGRAAPIEDENHVGLDSGFIVPSTPQGRDVYIRIVTTTSLTASVDVLPYDEANQRSHVMGGAVALYFAFLLAFSLWGLVNWGVRQDALYGLFALRQLFSMAHIFVFFGLLRFFLSHTLSAETRDLIYALVCCTVLVPAGYFDTRLISEFGGSRWIRRVLIGILSLHAVVLMLIALDRTQDALQMGSVLVNLVMVTLVAFAFSTGRGSEQPYGRASLWFIRGGFLLMASVVVVPVLMYQNVLHSSVPMFKILFLHAVISTVILFSLLSLRARQRDLLAQEARLMMQVKEAELQRESGLRIEKERFISMLTHELRNPLTVIQLMRDSDQSSVATARKAARDMASVIDRVEMSERVEAAGTPVETTRFDAAELVAELVQGHDAADRISLESGPDQTIVTDRGLYRRIVENLLDNAAKYSARGSVIQVRQDREVRGKVAGVRLDVSNVIGDAGAPDPERLFSKYYRSKRAHRHPGSGLGLFLIAGWVEALGGEIRYAPKGQPPGPQEARFSLWLPA
ncbi:MAG: hypothetical protein RIT14_2607 [Pseudomonadota bacterium]|jgi:signal transduction histidine kinase